LAPRKPWGEGAFPDRDRAGCPRVKEGGVPTFVWKERVERSARERNMSRKERFGPRRVSPAYARPVQEKFWSNLVSLGAV